MHYRDPRVFRWLGDARQDVTHAVRLLRRAPLFTFTAALSLAIGIGANTAIFAVANALVFRAPDGVVDARTLVDIGTLRGDGGLNPISFPTYLEIRRRTTTLSDVFAQGMFPAVMSLGAPPPATAEPVVGHSVTLEFFAVLRAVPAAGRFFDGRDGGRGRPGAVVVLSHGFWARRFNQNRDAIGQSLRINGRAFTIVGVAARGFQGTGVTRPDLWLPLGADGNNPGSVIAGGRLKPGVPVGEAAAELATIGSTLERESGTARQAPPLHVLPLSRAAGNRNLVFGFAGVLMIIVSIVLAVACANVAAILLTRAVGRSREMALRTALGARRSRLVRQLLTETVVLFLVGGVLGIWLAAAMAFLVPLLPALPMPVWIPLTLDGRVMAFTATLSLLAAIVSGVAPAFKGSKADPVTSLKDDSHSSARGSRLRSAFVVGQVALSLVLVVMAGLFVRAMRHAGSADPGFDPRGVDIATLDLSMARYDDSSRPAFWRDTIRTVRELPDVETASLARVLPGGFEGIGLGGISPAGSPSEGFSPAWNIVDTGYFATLRIPLLAGRDFSDADTAGAPPVVIVSEGVARRFWPGETAIGKHVRVPALAGRGPWGTRTALVIGVARDVKSSSLVDGLASAFVYLPLQQNDTPIMSVTMSILARSRQGRAIAAELRSLVARLDPQLVIVASQTAEESVALGLAPQRILSIVTGGLGTVGLFLAAVGIYGVTAFAVVRRSRELGIRMALGARGREIVGMLLRQGLSLTILGTAIGLLLSAGISQVLSVFLYGLPALHLPTFAGTALLFMLVGLTASYIPAYRVVRLDPLRALRHE
jgi:predicted permease